MSLICGANVQTSGYVKMKSIEIRKNKFKTDWMLKNSDNEAGLQRSLHLRSTLLPHKVHDRRGQGHGHVVLRNEAPQQLHAMAVRTIELSQCMQLLCHRANERGEHAQPQLSVDLS